MSGLDLTFQTGTYFGVTTINPLKTVNYQGTVQTLAGNGTLSSSTGFGSNDYLAAVPFYDHSLFLGFDFGQPSFASYNGGQVTGAVLPIVDGYYNLSATLNPVPEPGSLALLGTGLFALGLLARRRRRA